MPAGLSIGHAAHDRTLNLTKPAKLDQVAASRRCMMRTIRVREKQNKIECKVEGENLKTATQQPFADV